MIVYQVFYFFAVICYLPILLYQMIRYKKYRKSFLKRLGFFFPKIDKRDNQLIWIHAVSVGEARAVAKLVKHLKEDHPQILIVVSSITETGHAEAKKSMPFADYHVYLPFDFSWVMRPLMKKIRPDLVIIVETDYWYSFLTYAKRYGAKIVVVNGKVSEKSAKRYQLFHVLTNKLLSLIDMFCVQNDRYKKRFTALGVPNDKIVVTGNLKFDSDYTKLSSEELADFKKRLGISNENVITIGSTHHPEELNLIKSMALLWQDLPNLKVVLVPRHPERFGAVAELLEQHQIPFVRFSQIDRKTGKERVILIDRMGLLTQCYQVSTLAIVAGSFTSAVGGHNILEPTFYGIPVLFGPYMQNQPDMLELIQHYGAGKQVSLSEINDHIRLLLADNKHYAAISMAADELISKIGGAVKSTKSVVNTYILSK